MDGPALLKVAFECISPSGTNSVQCFSRTLFITHALVIPEVFVKLVQKMSGPLDNATKLVIQFFIQTYLEYCAVF